MCRRANREAPNAAGGKLTQRWEEWPTAIQNLIPIARKRWNLDQESAVAKIETIAEQVAFPLSWELDGKSISAVCRTVRGDFNPLILSGDKNDAS